MELKHAHEEEVTEHDNGHIHKIVCYQDGCQQPFRVIQKFTNFLVRGMFLLVNGIQVGRRKREKGISEAEAKPDTNNSKPANTMAMIAEIVGLCTDIPLKTFANWHK